MACLLPLLQWRLAEVCQRLERNFEVLGVTAIEDRLQVNVCSCIIQFQPVIGEMVLKDDNEISLLRSGTDTDTFSLFFFHHILHFRMASPKQLKH